MMAVDFVYTFLFSMKMTVLSAVSFEIAYLLNSGSDVGWDEGTNFIPLSVSE
jgi:hypothetical protein